MKRQVCSGIAGLCLAVGMVLLLSLGFASAQEADGEPTPLEGVTPIFGDGRLSVAGSGFLPSEQVTLTVILDQGAPQQFMTTADDQGQFRLDTGLAVQPFTSVELRAEGDQGTSFAAITSVPPAPPTGDSAPRQAPTGGKAPAQVPPAPTPSLAAQPATGPALVQLPRTGSPTALVVTVSLVGAIGSTAVGGWLLRRRC